MQTHTKLRPDQSAQLVAGLAELADKGSFHVATAIALHWMVAYHLAADADRPEMKDMAKSVMDIISGASKAKGRAYRLRLAGVGKKVFLKLCTGKGGGKSKAQYNELVDAVASQSNINQAHAAINAWLNAAGYSTFDGLADFTGTSNRGNKAKKPADKLLSSVKSAVAKVGKDGKDGMKQAEFIPAVSNAIPTAMLVPLILRAAERLAADDLVELSTAFTKLAEERQAQPAPPIAPEMAAAENDKPRRSRRAATVTEEQQH